MRVDWLRAVGRILLALLALLAGGCEGIRIILDGDPSTIADQPMPPSAWDRSDRDENAARSKVVPSTRPRRPLVVAVLPLLVDHELRQLGIRPDPVAVQRQLIAELTSDPELRLLDAAACSPDALGVRLVPGRRSFRADELASIRRSCGADLVVAPRLEWTGRRGVPTCSITAVIAATEQPGPSTMASLPNVRAEMTAIEQSVGTAFRFVRTTIDRETSSGLAAPSK